MPHEIAIISGKGGTGKTTVAASFVSLAKNVVMADCDVDAPDLHILLKPRNRVTQKFHSSKEARIDTNLCTLCGICEDNCRFDAAKPPTINRIACEGCSVCNLVCPEKAIVMEDRLSGYLYDSETKHGPMAHARLLAGEGNSGKLVTEVRKLAMRMAEDENRDLVIIDGSPGIGCPVIATVTGIRLGVIVTEPTMSAMHDMNRVVLLLNRFKVKPMVIINKSDLNEDNSAKITRFCNNQGIEMLGRIPFDSITTRSLVETKALPEFAPTHSITVLLREMWNRIESLL